MDVRIELGTSRGRILTRERIGSALWKLRTNYIALVTLARTLEMVPERRVSAPTTATVMTPRTTAYSAIVWPSSSVSSPNRRFRYSIKGIHLLSNVARASLRRVARETCIGQVAESLRFPGAISPKLGTRKALATDDERVKGTVPSPFRVSSTVTLRVVSSAAMATIIDGTAISAKVRERVVRGAAEFIADTGHVRPAWSPSWSVRTRPRRCMSGARASAAARSEWSSFHESLPATASQADVLDAVDRWNADDRVDGILVQAPLPEGLDFKQVLDRIDPGKDVDGFHPLNVGRLVANQPGLRPCTPAGVMELLAAYDIPVTGANAVVVGRSDIVGKPVALLLLHQSATVTIAHATRDLPEVCRGADILVAAVGGGAHDYGRHGQARRDRDRRGHQPHRRRDRRRRGLRLGLRGRGGRLSPRCPRASGR